MNCDAENIINPRVLFLLVVFVQEMFLFVFSACYYHRHCPFCPSYPPSLTDVYIPKTFLSLSIVRTRYANEVDMAATRNDDFPLFCSSGLGFNNRTCTHIDRHSLIYVGLAPTTHLSSHYSYFGCNF